MTTESCIIDGFGPVPIVKPTDVAALGELIRAASGNGSALYPFGGGTMLHRGLPPHRVGQAVDLRGIDHVLEFPARDMTITVQAGITISKLQSLLASENLRLPIDIPQPDRATLGGSIAANVNGARRYGFGTFRDYVIGISALNDEGAEFKGGGRVVKNVAGYDIPKILVGSLGTLGIITQVTLKLRPGPEEEAIAILSLDAPQLPMLLDRLHETRTRPTCLELLNTRAAQAIFTQAAMPVPSTNWVMIVGFEGNPTAVAWQLQQLGREVGTVVPLEANLGISAQSLWPLLADWEIANEGLTLKACVLPSALAELCRVVEAQSDQVQLRAHAGNGILWGHWPDPISLETAQAQQRAWTQSGGQVVVSRCPSAWKKNLSIFESRADAWLMKDIKKRFDPRNIFNPDRFLEGL